MKKNCLNRVILINYERKEIKKFKITSGLAKRHDSWTQYYKKTDFKPENFQLEHVEVTITNLNPIFDDYCIVNISDIHLGQWISSKHLKGVVDLINNQKPDAITITGDFVSYILEEVAEDLEVALKKLNPKEISIAVLGNHDHWMGADKIREILKKCNIIDASNDIYTLKRGEAQLHIAGVDSVMLNKHRLDLVIEKLPEEGPAILLAHEPDFADVSSSTGRFSLQISGHSHGGQFIIPGLGTFI